MTLWIKNLSPVKPHWLWGFCRMVFFQINDCNCIIRWKRGCLGQGNDCPFSQVICLITIVMLQHNVLAHEMQLQPLHFGAQFLVIIFHHRLLVIFTDVSVVSTMSLALHQINPTGSCMWSKHLPLKAQGLWFNNITISTDSLFIQSTTPFKINIKGPWFSSSTSWQHRTYIPLALASMLVRTCVLSGEILLPVVEMWLGGTSCNSILPVQSWKGHQAPYISAIMRLDCSDK